MPRRKRQQLSISRRLHFEQLQPRELLASDLQLQHNAFDPEDVNDDGALSSADALIVINQLNARTPRSDGHFVDVNADGRRSPLDALMVINRLNRGGSRDNRGDRDAGETPEPTEADVRSLDGTGNNLDQAEWGSSGERLLRAAAADYTDGIAAPAGEDRPSAREISNLLSDHGAEAIPNERDTLAFLYVWGQFLDHDIDLTVGGEGNEAFDIEVPAGDPLFDPEATGLQTIPFSRSQFDPATGSGTDGFVGRVVVHPPPRES